MDNSALDAEQQKIISYLCAYGNTRETDLITYGVQKLGKSENNMRKVLDEMVFHGRVKRIMHRELHPAVPYIDYGSMIPFELEFQVLADSLGPRPEDNETIKDIHAKAKMVAEKRIKKRFRP